MRSVLALLIMVSSVVGLGYMMQVAWSSLPSLPGRESVRQATLNAAEAAEAALERQAYVSERSDIRFVEQEGIVGVRADGPLERLPSTVEVPPPPSPEVEPEIYRLAVIEDANTINVRTHTLQLAHIEAPGLNDTCAGSTARWPCGMRARTELRRLVRRRALECRPVEPPTAPVDVASADLAAGDTAATANGPGVAVPVPTTATGASAAPADAMPIARCEVAGTDLSEWLVRQGWATPTEGAPQLWTRLHQTAQASKIGKFAPDGR